MSFDFLWVMPGHRGWGTEVADTLPVVVAEVKESYLSLNKSIHNSVQHPCNYVSQQAISDLSQLFSAYKNYFRGYILKIYSQSIHGGPDTLFAKGEVSFFSI